MKAHLKLPLVPGRSNPAVIEIGGVDIASAVHRLVIEASAKHEQITALTVDLILYDGVTVDGEVEVIVPDDTRAALLALGWTPPGEFSSAAAVPAGSDAPGDASPPS